MRKYVLYFLVLFVCILPAVGCDPTPKGTSVSPVTAAPFNNAALQDDFEGGSLDPSLWKTTRANDFAESVADVFNVDQGQKNDYRLRLRADTIGTNDDTVKFLGIRSLKAVDLQQGTVISFDLDWNNQANGSYLTAGIYLCPIATDTNPALQPDWIAFEYVGVPPGKNARFQISQMNSNNLHLLFTEGWPEQQRIGREIANQRLELTVDGKKLIVRENGNEIFSSAETGIDFTQAYLYLQMSSHSNYPAREVYFDNVCVRKAPTPVQIQ